MALILRVRTLDGLTSSGERVIKATFRGNKQSSRVHSGQNSVYFGHEFKWPVGRHLNKEDVVVLDVFNVPKIGRNKLIGNLTVSLEQIIHQTSINCTENLSNARHAVIGVVLNFELHYNSPDASAGPHQQNDYNYPTHEFKRKRRFDMLDDDSETDESIESGDALTYRLDDESSSTYEASSIYSQDEVSLYGNEIREHMAVPHVQPATVFSKEFYQICVIIQKADIKTDDDIYPVVKVSIDDDVRETEKQHSTRPTYNKAFFFEFERTHYEVMDLVIKISVHDRGSWYSSLHDFEKHCKGEFRIDVRSIFNSKGHAIYHKWAVLVDPKNLSLGPLGFVKCSFTAVGRNQQLLPEPKDSEVDSIEGNILLPIGMTSGQERRTVRMSVCIYLAEDLPPMNTRFIASVKNAFSFRSNKDLADPYVHVYFSGEHKKTKTCKDSYDPRWLQQIIFTDSFPPLCNRIRISICDSDAFKDTEIATHYIDLNQIMDMTASESGFLPTFGPSWINLYGATRYFGFESMMNYNRDLNLGMGDGAAYRGRILVQVTSEVKSGESEKTVPSKLTSCSDINVKERIGRKADFLLVGVIYEANAIDAASLKQYKDGEISFELSIGTYGNKLDGNYEEDDGELCAEPARSKYLPMWCHSTSDPYPPTHTDKDLYCHIEYRECKPCLYLRCQFEDHRQRMFMPNIVEKLADQFEIKINDFRKQLRREELRKKAGHRMNNRKLTELLMLCLAWFSDEIDDCSSVVYSCRGSGNRNNLDKHRSRMVRSVLEKLKVKVEIMSNKQYIKSNTFSNLLAECRSLIQHMREVVDDPQHGLPDVFVWMLIGAERVAYTRIASRDIIHSIVDEERGKHCGTVASLFLRKPGHKGTGEGGYFLQAQLHMYLWLGMLKDLKFFRQSIPEGYAPLTFKEKRPPDEIVYEERSVFQLRAYILSARSLLANDPSGLSDAFARVSISHHILTTPVIETSLSPRWDCTLVIPAITFYQNANTIKDFPPIIVVDIFDDNTNTPSDEVVKSMKGSKFLGRAFCNSQVTLHHRDGMLDEDMEDYMPPRLQWCDVYRNQTAAGEVFAAFELLELKPDHDGNLTCLPPDIINLDDPVECMIKHNGFYSVPNSIKPKCESYRLEVLFWGVREIGRVKFFKCTRPQVTMEFSGCVLHSEKLENSMKQPNFDKNYLQCQLKIDLPRNRDFWPPMTFKCTHMIPFGGEDTVGVALVCNMGKYFVEDKVEVLVEAPQEEDGGDSDSSSDTSSTKDDKTVTANGKTKSLANGSVKANKELQPPGIVHDANTIPERKKPPRPGLINETDWWARFYASEKDLANEADDDDVFSSEDEMEVDALEGIAIEIEQEELEVEKIVEPDLKERKKRKKRCAMLKRRMKQGAKLVATHTVMPDSAMKFEAEEKEEKDEKHILIYNDDKEEDDSWITRLKLYKGCLEDQPEFGKFEETFISFPLFRGGQNEDEDMNELRAVGYFKGNIRIRKCLPEDEDRDVDQSTLMIDDVSEDERMKEFLLYKQLPSSETIKVKVRCYIVKCTNLPPMDSNGLSDPYLIVRLGSTMICDRTNHICNTLNPVFGRLFEFDAQFPQDSVMEISVYDYDASGNIIPDNLRVTASQVLPQISDDFIGSTKIDLENRFYSKHEARCGLPLEYSTRGYNKWRNLDEPTITLGRLMGQHFPKRPKPDYKPNLGLVTVNTDAKHTFVEDAMLEDENNKLYKSNEPLALKVLHNWKEVADFSLVPEHVETRPLMTKDRPGIAQGHVVMWVDMYPMERAGSAISVPPAIDITPRKPEGFQLRLIVRETTEVVLDDTNILTGEKSSDIFVKCMMKPDGSDDDKKTDTHANSMTGDGSFNWRLIFDFEYEKFHNKIVYASQGGLLSDSEMKSAECTLTIEVWDQDLIFANTKLGSITFPLNKIPRPAKSANACGVHQLPDTDVKTFSIFKNKGCKGWWPVVRQHPDKPKKKQVSGKVLAELQLLPAEEAASDPAGIGREPPHPLSEPQRPERSFLSLFNPLKIIKYLVCVKFRCLLIKLLIVTIFTLLLVLFIYSSPGYIAKKMIGA